MVKLDKGNNKSLYQNKLHQHAQWYTKTIHISIYQQRAAGQKKGCWGKAGGRIIDMVIKPKKEKSFIQRFYLFYLAVIFIFCIPLIYALGYGEGSYGRQVYGTGEETPISPVCRNGACESGETCSSCPNDCGECGAGGGSDVGGGGGGSTSAGIKYECSSDSDCKIDQYCFDHTCHDAECLNDSSCNTKKGETCWNHRCVKLFDMEILKFESPARLGEFFDFTYFLKAVAEINGDVEIDFWIERDGNIVTSGKDTIYMGSFEEKTKTKQLFLPSDISSGTYKFFIKVTYGTYTASAYRTIEININEGLATIKAIPEFGYLINYAISGLIVFGVIVACLIFFFRKRRNKRRKGKRRKNKQKKKNKERKKRRRNKRKRKGKRRKKRRR